MVVEYPESALSNWFIDILMARTEELAGRKVDVGIGNFGGIRIDMPQGDIILDDMLSMFPFKNQLVYVEHTGKQIRSILEEMAAGRFQVLGGVRVVAENGRLVSAEIAGEPIDDDKTYTVGMTKNCVTKFKRYFGAVIPEDRITLTAISTFSDLARWMISQKGKIEVKGRGRFGMLHTEYLYMD
jgi:2',3'-cyclic-nucleotide 2'-phosphodiesterase (5'-nucleotidase family)